MGDYARSSVENVAFSLVREFLSTKGFYTILLNMDVEIPRDPDSINSRHILSSILGLQRPARGTGSILEALVKKAMSRRGSINDMHERSHKLEASYKNSFSITEQKDINSVSPCKAENENISNNTNQNNSPMPCEIEETQEKIIIDKSKSSSTEESSENLTLDDEDLKVIETDIVVTNVVEHCEVDNKNEQEESEPQLDSTNDSYCDYNNAVQENCVKLVESENTTNQKTSAPSKIIISQKRYYSTFLTKLPIPKLRAISPPDTKDEPIETISEVELIEKQPPEKIFKSPPLNSSAIRPLTLPSAMELKSVLLGTPEGQFLREWREGELLVPADAFRNLEIGVSGVLAVIHGFVVRALTFCNVKDRETAFTSAIAELLWQSGQQCRACLAICGEEERLAGCGRYRRDGVTEAMVLLNFNSIEDTRAGIERHVGQLRAPGGLLLLVASLVLSKGLEEFRGRPPLLGKANLSLVNLTLTGRLDMREAKQRAEIGLLSLAEHYGYLKVPSCLKTPRWPIWVVEMGPEKYAVVSSTNPKLVADWRAELAFRLQVFDNEGSKIAAITTGGEINEEEEKTANYLEMTIRTKWGGAQFQWIPNN